MSDSRRKRFQLLATQFESLLRNLSECRDSENRKEFLTRMKLVINEVDDLTSGKCTSTGPEGGTAAQPSNPDGEEELPA